MDVSGYLQNTMKFKTSNLLLGWRATAGMECILGSAIYLKSTGMSLVRKNETYESDDTVCDDSKKFALCE